MIKIGKGGVEGKLKRGQNYNGSYECFLLAAGEHFQSYNMLRDMFRGP